MCVLRAFGEHFEPEAFLASSSISAYSVFHKGNKQFKTSDRVFTTSGFKVDVSKAEWADREVQIQDALQFLRLNTEELQRLIDWKGVDEVVLDFPFEAADIVTNVKCPVELSRQSSALGISLEFSIYPETEEEE